MSILFRNSDDGVSSANPTQDVDKPVGTLEGDLIVLTYTSDGDTFADVPTGFTEVYQYNGSPDSNGIQVFQKTAGASEPASYTVTKNASVRGLFTSESYYDDVGGGAWVIGTPATGDSASGVPLSLGPITTEDNSLLLGAWANDSFSTVTSPPSGMTLSTAGPSGGSVALHTYYELIITGASESRSLTYSGDTSVGGLFNVAYEVAGASISQTDTTPEDGVEQTVTATGMSGPITAATLGGVSILSELSSTDPSSPITYLND